MKEFMDFNLEIKSEDVKDDGTFEGYGSTFGGKPDSYGDVIEKGAFMKSLSKGGRNGNGIAMLWQHNPNFVPGKWTDIHEDSKGLYVRGKLIKETQLGKEAHILLKEEAIKGMSIGYQVVKDSYDKVKDIRTLKELNLWEISLVTFPANTSATITSVKAFEDIKTERELESLLRESGVSKQVALYLVKLCKPSLRELEKGDKKFDDILTELREANRNIAGII